MSDAAELEAWLRAQYDQIAELAGACTPGPWEVEEPFLADVVTAPALHGVRIAHCMTEHGYRPGSLPDARHIALHDPVLVLADVEAKRTILDLVASWAHDRHDDGWFSCSQAVLPEWRRTDPQDAVPGSACHDEDRAGQPCDCGLDTRRMALCKRLAAPFAGRDGWLGEWAIDG